MAANHNLYNKGSHSTTWIERVMTFRPWRFEMDGLDPNSPTPPSTMEWRDSCKRMYVEKGNVLDANTTLNNYICIRQSMEYSRTSLTRTPKGNGKWFELAGFYCSTTIQPILSGHPRDFDNWLLHRGGHLIEVANAEFVLWVKL